VQIRPATSFAMMASVVAFASAACSRSPREMRSGRGPQADAPVSDSQVGGEAGRLGDTALTQPVPPPSVVRMPSRRQNSSATSHGSLLRFAPVAPGLDFLDTVLQVPGRQLRLTIARVAYRGPFIVRLAATRDPSRGGLSLGDFEQQQRAAVVLSGGFLRSFYPPVPAGFLKVGGEVLNRWAKDPVLNGYVWLGPHGARIAEANSDSVPQPAADGLQTGPLMVLGGRVDKGMWRTRGLSAESDERAFIAVDSQGNILLGHTSPVALGSLARLLASNVEDGGLGIRGAVNLSGDVNAGLRVRALKFRVGDNTVQLHNAFVVVPRGDDD
jgi:hypothetical protein